MNTIIKLNINELRDAHIIIEGSHHEILTEIELEKFNDFSNNEHIKLIAYDFNNEIYLVHNHKIF